MGEAKRNPSPFSNPVPTNQEDRVQAVRNDDLFNVSMLCRIVMDIVHIRRVTMVLFGAWNAPTLVTGRLGGKMLRTILIAAIFVTTGTAYAQTQPCTSTTGRTVSVNGAANLRLAPDRVSFTIGVRTEAASVAEAFKTNTSRVNAVIRVLKERGVKPQEIQTSNLAITSRNDTSRRPPGFQVSNVVTVTREDTASIGELLQAAVQAGANEVGNLRFFIADPSKLQPRGLELAFLDAKAKAEKLASVSGRTLGPVVCVSSNEGVFQSEGYMARGMADMVQNAPPSIEAGMENVFFRVSAVFELK